MSLEERASTALMMISTFGQIDGEHHKMWVIDQVARALLEEHYADWIAGWEACDPEDCTSKERGHCYEWDEGIAP